MSSSFKFLMPVVAALLAITGCSSSSDAPARRNAEAEKPTAPVTTPTPESDPNKVFKVKFDTSKGPILIEVHRDWAPIGAQRFEELVKAGFFDGARFFRVVPNFVVQFGLAARPALTKKWDKALKDDPVTQTNRPGTLAFATMGRNTRTSQIFINLASNQSLDADGFAPFARVVEGMDVVQHLYSGYGESPDQEAITKQGNPYLEKNFPKLDYIRKATIL
jgi:cyclophilin family peptidyl-prolyl cis-trans isomerase